MRTLFFSQYLKNIRSVGSITPSSRYLARKMLAPINFDRAKVIVEYGPGTGVFTAELIARKRPSTTLLVIESNPEFYQLLIERFADEPHVVIVNQSAEHVAKLLKSHELARPDYIVSGLPFAALPADLTERILEQTTQLLGERGMFITFQYTLLKRQLFQRYFAHVRITSEPRNTPPAFVLGCQNTIPR